MPLRIPKALAVALALASVLTIPRVLRPDALVITRAMLATTIAEIWVERDSVAPSGQGGGTTVPPTGGM